MAKVVVALLVLIVGHAALSAHGTAYFFAQLTLPMLALLPALAAHERGHPDLGWKLSAVFLIMSRFLPVLWICGMTSVALIALAAQPGPSDEAPVSQRMGLLAAVAITYVIASCIPALYFDVKTPNHGDNMGTGIGSPEGLFCLLFGWTDPLYVMAWAANIPLLGALVALAFKRGRLAHRAAALANLMALSTPCWLYLDPLHPQAHLLSGYLLWQGSILGLAVGTRALYGQRDAAFWPVTFLALLLSAGFAVTPKPPPPAPPIQPKPTKSLVLLVKARLHVPPGVRWEDVQAEVVLPRARGQEWRKAIGKDLTPKLDGQVSLQVFLSSGTRPQTAEVMFRAPSAGRLEFKDLKDFQPDPASGFVLDLHDLTLPPLQLKALQGPATFVHPGLPYTVEVPQDWMLKPAESGLQVTLEKGSSRVTVEAATWDQITAAEEEYRRRFPYPAKHKQVNSKAPNFGRFPRYDAYRNSDIRDFDRLRSFATWQAPDRCMNTVEDTVTILYGRLAYLSIRGEAHGKSQSEADAAFTEVMKVVDSVHAP